MTLILMLMVILTPTLLKGVHGMRDGLCEHQRLALTLTLTLTLILSLS